MFAYILQCRLKARHQNVEESKNVILWFSYRGKLEIINLFIAISPEDNIFRIWTLEASC